MWIELKKQNLTRKKRQYEVVRQPSERVQILRCEYWEKVKNIDPENLVFLDKMGLLLGFTRTHARSISGSRVYDLQPFYRGAKVTVVGAISTSESSRINDHKWVDGRQGF